MKSDKRFALLWRPRKTEFGVSAVEYGIIAAAVCLVVAGVIWGFGGDIAQTFSNLQQGFQKPAN